MNSFIFFPKTISLCKKDKKKNEEKFQKNFNN